MITLLKGNITILTIDEDNALHWVNRDEAPKELVRRSEQRTLPLVGGGPVGEMSVTTIEDAKRGTYEWVLALIDAVWRLGLDVEGAVPQGGTQ